ncbi:hypothetical protein EWB00_004257 [Schistosoma japonicum]|uniref:BHLH domain-containing protein n=1 Tax=Schistosoma japonicum TaxID=6182 RepID=A0A4Z2D5H2_SCHJA|nr:STARP antigen [Schistosoma japonicum]TNN11737.1 hypothetical protein EWB00_004257 [Schistosoma japonicum]
MNNRKISTLVPCQASTPNVNDKSKVKKHNSFSTVSTEYREQTRRLKKQNLERRRRECISDKMNALHNLALNLIGKNPTQLHKIEKTDILNICQCVFENVVAIVNEQPDIRERVHRLRYEFHDKLNSNHFSTSKNKQNINDTQNSDSNLKCHQLNYAPFNFPMKTYSSEDSVICNINKKCDSFNTDISNDTSYQTTNRNSLQQFKAEVHSPTPLASIRVLNTSTNTPIIKPIFITPYSQSLDSGIEDTENTQSDISCASLQSINCIQQLQSFRTPQRILKQNYYSNWQSVENEIPEQIIDLSLKKQNQINDNEVYGTTNRKHDVWRPYLD